MTKPGRQFLWGHNGRKPEPSPVPTGDGYLRMFLPTHPLAAKDGYVLEHRLVAYRAGILTDFSDHVHHLNGVKDDNRPENLAALPAADHHKNHIGENVVNQSGTHPVIRDPALRKARADELNRANARRWRLKYPERAKAADQRKREKRSSS